MPVGAEPTGVNQDASGELSGPVYSLLADDPDFGELLREFAASAREKRESLQAAFDASDWGALQVESHRLKGSGTGYGFPQLTALAAELEQACRGVNPLRIREALQQVRDYLGRIRVS